MNVNNYRPVSGNEDKSNYSECNKTDQVSTSRAIPIGMEDSSFSEHKPMQQRTIVPHPDVSSSESLINIKDGSLKESNADSTNLLPDASINMGEGGNSIIFENMCAQLIVDGYSAMEGDFTKILLGIDNADAKVLNSFMHSDNAVISQCNELNDPEKRCMMYATMDENKHVKWLCDENACYPKDIMQIMNKVSGNIADISDKHRPGKGAKFIISVMNDERPFQLGISPKQEKSVGVNNPSLFSYCILINDTGEDRKTSNLGLWYMHTENLHKNIHLGFNKVNCEVIYRRTSATIASDQSLAHPTNIVNVENTNGSGFIINQNFMKDGKYCIANSRNNNKNSGAVLVLAFSIYYGGDTFPGLTQ